MFVKLSRDGVISLEDRDNFRAFKLVIEDDPSALASVQAALKDIAQFDGPAVGWVLQDALRKRPEVLGDTAWLASFEAMIEKSRPHGWIDDQRQAIKAHVEWTEAH